MLSKGTTLHHTTLSPPCLLIFNTMFRMLLNRLFHDNFSILDVILIIYIYYLLGYYSTMSSASHPITLSSNMEIEDTLSSTTLPMFHGTSTPVVSRISSSEMEPFEEGEVVPTQPVTHVQATRTHISSGHDAGNEASNSESTQTPPPPSENQPAPPTYTPLTYDQYMES
jgi:hypothetical protein